MGIKSVLLQIGIAQPFLPGPTHFVEGHQVPATEKSHLVERHQMPEKKKSNRDNSNQDCGIFWGILKIPRVIL